MDNHFKKMKIYTTASFDFRINSPGNKVLQNNFVFTTGQKISRNKSGSQYTYSQCSHEKYSLDREYKFPNGSVLFLEFVYNMIYRFMIND